MAENFPHVYKECDIQRNEAYRSSNSHDQNKTTPLHIIIKISETHHKTNIKSCQRTETDHLKGKPIRTTVDLTLFKINSDTRISLHVLLQCPCPPRGDPLHAKLMNPNPNCTHQVQTPLEVHIQTLTSYCHHDGVSHGFLRNHVS